MVRMLLILGVLGMSVVMAAPVVAGAENVQHPRETVVIFGDISIDGELRRPDGDYLVGRQRARFDSMINLRDDFLDELQVSVDDL